jgi:DNA-binding MurR/RpiR family transcriptional regulator
MTTLDARQGELDRESVLEPFVVAHPSIQNGTDGIALSRKQRALVSYIEHNPKFAAFATAAELGRRAGSHPSTVVRLAQMLGYDGFPEFQEAIRHRYIASLNAVALMRAHATELDGDVALASLDQEIRNLSATRSTLDRNVLRLVAVRILQARSVLIVGFASHGGVAQIVTHLGRFMGLPFEAENRGGVTLATRLATLGPEDVVIGTAAWWVIRDTREALAAARAQGATTVAVVDNRASPLAQVADHVLITRTESVSFFQSMLGPLAVFNALIAEIAAAGGTELRERMDATTRMFERLDVAWHGAATPIEIASGVAGDAEQPAGVNPQRGQSRRRLSPYRHSEPVEE